MDSAILKKSNAGFFRRLKRRFRDKVNWNNWTLKAQLRTHLISMVLAFFIGHFIFLILTTWYQYQSSVISQVHDSLLDIFSTKLNYTSNAITLCYQQNENTDVLTVKRLQRIVSDFNKYPASYSNTPAQLVDQNELTVNQTVYGLGATCLYPLSAKEKFVS
jgi:hypothetical protein